MTSYIILAVWFALFNVLAAFATVSDKNAARRGQRRIPESHLLFLAFLGGALGEWIAMYAVRHKTRKFRFAVGIPLMLLLQIAMLALLVIGGVL